MKKIIISSLLFFFTVNSFGQQVTEKAPLLKGDYLKKSKSQKTAAWCLLGGGFLVSTIGVGISAAQAAEEVGNLFVGALGGTTVETEQNNSGEILFITGLASMVGSIPLFVASSRNKRTAAGMAAAIKIENSSLMRQATVAKIQYPALSVKISF